MDLDKIKTLIDFVGQSRISELSVTENGTTVRISHYTRPQDAIVTARAVDRKDGVADAQKPSAITVSAPMFGILHRAPNPGATPFVAVGDQVDVGQSLFIIEAMKVFNTITAETAGKIVRILVEDGQEVDTGQPMLEIAG
jgi:acetyl-CoA carboxylase biotin carboxyl carrier protein